MEYSKGGLLLVSLSTAGVSLLWNTLKDASFPLVYLLRRFLLKNSAHYFFYFYVIFILFNYPVVFQLIIVVFCCLYYMNQKNKRKKDEMKRAVQNKIQNIYHKVG